MACGVSVERGLFAEGDVSEVVVGAVGAERVHERAGLDVAVRAREWFASESTPQIWVLITQHLRGFRHLHGRGLDDRAGRFSRQCRRVSTEAVSLAFAEV